jgi:hypothetical protein
MPEEFIHKMPKLTSLKMDLSRAGVEAMDWIDLGQDWDMCRALVNTVGNIRTAKCGEFLTS